MTTTHSHCTHEATKSARAACRKARAAQPRVDDSGFVGSCKHCQTDLYDYDGYAATVFGEFHCEDSPTQEHVLNR